MAFSEEQLHAINSNSRTILCLAGAGAGKSTVLVNRTYRLISEGVNPRSILSLTFTNAAGFEMGQRFKKLSQDNPVQPEFRTFHSFAYSLVVKDLAIRSALGYTKVPNICDEAQFKKIKTEVRMQLKIILSDEELASDGSELSMRDKKQYDMYHKHLKTSMLNQNLITFDMLNNDVSELFAKNDATTLKYKQKYEYINVDEYQDTDDAQMRFLNSFPETTKFFFVADALQNLYSFRGCTNKYVKMLSKDKNWEKIFLHNNYRCTNQICDYANKFSASYADSAYRIEMLGQRDGEDVEVYYGAHSSFDSPVSYNHVKKLVDKVKASDEECAILCRTNREVQYICDTFKEFEIPFVTSNKSTDDKDLLQSALDNDYMLNWLSTFLDASKYAEYIRLAAQLENPDIRWFLSTYGSNAKIKPKANKIIEIRKVLSSSLSLEEKFEKIVKLVKTNIPDHTLEGITGPSSLIQYIIDLITEVEEHRVYVGTIHSSKGLEYEHVYLMGVGDKAFPLDCEDNKNCYYVGLTRARDRLTVFKA